MKTHNEPNAGPIIALVCVMCGVFAAVVGNTKTVLFCLILLAAVGLAALLSAGSDDTPD